MVMIENLSFCYEEDNAIGAKKREGLHNINLHIRKGEFVLLCGESGCGKTTVIRLINALIPHFYNGKMTGQVNVAGNITTEIKASDLMLLCGSVFQNPRSQFFNTDTTSEIAFGLENLALDRNEIRRKVEKTVSVLDIGHLMDRNIFALSGGEKQLVAIASAYAPEPDIFVFDEPSSNLDRASINELAALLAILKKDRKTIIIAEHRLYYLAGLIDRAVYLEQGAITHEWDGQTICSMPQEIRQSFGLRALNLEDLQPEQKQIGEKNRNTNILRVAIIKAFYKKKKSILSSLSFEVKSGEVIGIVGANGAGKSTLARTLCGLHRKSTGTVELDGKILSRSRRPGIFNMVMQETSYQLFTDSVENELRAQHNNYISDEDIQAILKKLSLLEYRERHPMSLSGGQKQRLAIGVAMTLGAKVIIFDEPTSGLDFRNMRRVCDIIEFMRSQGKIIFVITHDYELLLAVCTRLFFLEDGAISSDVPVTTDNLEEIKNVFENKLFREKIHKTMME
jgi:energy-coupling factor transport system ATP-binding protein